jgi:hypothetical protein
MEVSVNVCDPPSLLPKKIILLNKDLSGPQARFGGTGKPMPLPKI